MREFSLFGTSTGGEEFRGMTALPFGSGHLYLVVVLDPGLASHLYREGVPG